jgi:hypothetical protein
MAGCEKLLPGWLTGCILPDMSGVTQLFKAIASGDPNAADQLLPLAYEELWKLAALKLAREVPRQTLQPTALVHEAWLRLVAQITPLFRAAAISSRPQPKPCGES